MISYSYRYKHKENLIFLSEIYNFLYLNSIEYWILNIKIISCKSIEIIIFNIYNIFIYYLKYRKYFKNIELVEHSIYVYTYIYYLYFFL